MQPEPGQVYRSPKGTPMLYVRTEQRPGSDVPEHLFISTESRTVLQRWTREVPAEFELIIDYDGRRQANEQRWLTLVAEHERDLAHRLLRRATAWLPPERARELRDEWRKAQPPEEER